MQLDRDRSEIHVDRDDKNEKQQRSTETSAEKKYFPPEEEKRANDLRALDPSSASNVYDADVF